METIQGSEPQIEVRGKPYPVTLLGFPAPLIGAGHTYESVSDQIGDVPLQHPHQKAWFAGFTRKYVIIVMLQARSGGADAAPIAGRILEAACRGAL